MAKDKKEMVEEVEEEEVVLEEEPIPEPTPEPVKEKQGDRDVIYTANGPMYKNADGTLEAKLD
jgi:hypothetical protein